LGEYFDSFEEAWSFFLERAEPLEDFFEEFTGGAFVGEAWLIVPSPEIKRAALAVQSELEALDWLTLVPHHFLHVSLTMDAASAFDEPVELEYARVGCFHTAVVVEVDSPQLHALDPHPKFLPHMTVAVVTGTSRVDELREILAAHRDDAFGTQRVDEIVRVWVELSREHVFEPWTVLERVHA
jgi:2'-5' RNA ligase